METPTYQPLLHRIAVLTACAALLPIIVGGLVTTMEAGMAFPDWPSSDGHGMLTYPWLSSAGDKFLEHGHRLAGMFIGLCSIALAVVMWWKEPRAWVRNVTTALLVCVVLQGGLGGGRVLLNSDGTAFVHGIFAGIVFAMMAAVALFTSRGWLSSEQETVSTDSGGLVWLAAAASAVLFVQYILGGLLRHLGLWPYHHLGFAALTAIVVMFLVGAAHFSNVSWLRRPAYLLCLLLAVQLGLGAGAWVTKFGFDGSVVVAGSTNQVLFRTAHVVVGMLTFMVSTVCLLRASRLHYLRSRAAALQSAVPPPTLERHLHVQGGLG